MSINGFVEMTIFLCLICFSIYEKMHRFQDKCVFAIYVEIQDDLQKWQENDI